MFAHALSSSSYLVDLTSPDCIWVNNLFLGHIFCLSGLVCLVVNMHKTAGISILTVHFGAKKYDLLYLLESVTTLSCVNQPGLVLFFFFWRKAATVLQSHFSLSNLSQLSELWFGSKLNLERTDAHTKTLSSPRDTTEVFVTSTTEKAIIMPKPHHWQPPALPACLCGTTCWKLGCLEK